VELDGVRSRKLSNVGQSLDGWPKIYYIELLRASEGTLSRWSRLYLQLLTPTNMHLDCVMGWDQLSLWVIHKGRQPINVNVETLIGWWWYSFLLFLTHGFVRVQWECWNIKYYIYKKYIACLLHKSIMFATYFKEVFSLHTMLNYVLVDRMWDMVVFIRN
jgi:hypothetical protein